MALLKFPKNFLWGGAVAAEQHEGKKGSNGRTKWDLHYEKRPEDFFYGIGPSVTSDFISNFKSDVKLWKETIGINSIRISTSWARLFPDGETLDVEAAKFYHDVFDTLNTHGIKVINTLFHFDMPEWAIKIGGWSNIDVVNKFVKYAKFIFDEYDSKIHMFATMNEPIVPIFAGYLKQGNHWPRVYDPQLAFDVGNRMILAHARAVKAHRAKERSSKIGVIINVSPSHPRDKSNPKDVEAARTFHTMHNLWMLDPMLNGIFPTDLKEYFKKIGATKFILTEKEVKEISDVHVDFVGTNFYFPTRLKAYEGEKVKYSIQKLAMPWKDPDARMNIHRGWEIFPEDIYKTAMIIKERYNNLPVYISENGMGVQNEERFRDSSGEINDKYRIAFVQEHLEWVHKAIQDGSNIFGYHMWSIHDCWSWTNGYKNRYGFIEIDIKSQKRTPKASAHWFKKVIKENSFNDKYIKLDDLMI